MSDRELFVNPNIIVRAIPSAKVPRYVIEDVVQKKFYRVGYREYLLLSAIQKNKEIGDAIRSARNTAPELEWSDRLIQEVIGWFAKTGLIAARPYDQIAETASKPTSPNPSPSFDPFFFRVPLIPGGYLESLCRWISWIFSLPVAMVAAVIGILAITLICRDPARIASCGSDLFFPGQWYYWMAAWFVLKVVHELGHATACWKMGGRIRKAGVGFFFAMPVPYVDLSDIWRLPTRRGRLLCSLAGILTEMSVASLGVIVCYWSESLALQYLGAAVASLGTIATIAFNANPLMKFDGYYALTDMIDHPNLWSDAKARFQGFLQNPQLFLRSGYDRFLITYGFLAVIYRTFIVLGFSVGAIATWHGFGVLAVGLAIYLWYLAPYLRGRLAARRNGSVAHRNESETMDMGAFSTNHPVRRGIWNRFREKLQATVRSRSAVIFAMATCGVVLLFVLPSPVQPLIPGCVSWKDPVSIRAEVSGFLKNIQVNDGQVVAEGDCLFELENNDVRSEYERLSNLLRVCESRCQAFRARSQLADLRVEEVNRESIRERWELAAKQLEGLTVRATSDGIFLSRHAHGLRGKFVSQGTSLGMVVPKRELEVTASLHPFDLATAQTQKNRRVIVDIEGAGAVIGTIIQVLPRGTNELRQMELAGIYGGPIPVKLMKPDSRESLQTASPRFELRIQIDADGLPMRPGQACLIRLHEERASMFNILARYGQSLWNWMQLRQSAGPNSEV